MSKDKIIRSTGEVIEVRFVIVDCTATANEIGKIHGAKAFALELMGESIASSLLLASGLKFRGAVEISYNFSGDLSCVQSTGTPSGHVRAKIDQEELQKIQEFDLMLSEQTMNVKKINDQGKTIWDSNVQMPSPKVGPTLSAYMVQSEQTRCAVGIKAECGEDTSTLQYCIGFIVELFPKAKDSTITQIEQSILQLGDLGKYYQAQSGFDSYALLKDLSHPYPFQIHQEIPVAHHCPCSQERVNKSIASLTKADIKSLLKDGGAEIFCDYCRTRYWLSKEDLTKMLK